jgi:glycosyltransferase involved in cell wall biosynthesis
MARIGINGVFLEPGRTGGAETYTRALVEQYQQIDSPHTFVLFVGRGHDVAIDHPRFEIVECDVDPGRRRRRVIWEQLRLPGLMARHNLDLAHFPYGALPLGYRGRSVVTLHDTLRFQRPADAGLVDRMYRRQIDRDIVRYERDVILPSKTDAELFQRHVGAVAHAVAHGVDAHLQPQGEADGEPCVLWVGRPYGYKNIDVLRRAHAASGVDLPLRLVSDMPHDRLAAVYRSAKVFCYPSLCESFALPVLEAMACGVAVIGNDLPSFRELYGDAMWYAKDEAELADAIRSVCTDESLRQQFVERGRGCAERYTWRRCAEATLAVYEAVLARGAG